MSCERTTPLMWIVSSSPLIVSWRSPLMVSVPLGFTAVISALTVAVKVSAAVMFAPEPWSGAVVGGSVGHVREVEKRIVLG